MSDGMLIGAVAFVALITVALYAIFGGADFGGGILDVVATGRDRTEQREAIAHAIGPVWETNHVWLIFLIVLSFTCFPSAFAAISVGLYVPLTFVLVGIILRGAAFAYRSNQYESTAPSRFWGRTFGIASSVAPFFFGAAVGGLTTGNFAWASPFALAVGAIAVALCAQVAAIFLTLETGGALRETFRLRAIVATVAVAAAGAVALAIAYATVPAFFARLIAPGGRAGVLTAMALGLAVLGALAARRFALARVAVAAQTIAILVGWEAAQAPYLIPGVATYQQAAAPPETLRAFLWLALAGSIALAPSLWLLFRIFKTAPATGDARTPP